MANKFNGYELSNGWFEFIKNNASKVNTNHSALYNYIVYRANKLGWPDEVGLPSDYTMHHSGFKTYKTYKNTLEDLHKFGVIRIVTKATNQYNATTIALVNLTKAQPKQSIKQDQSTIESKTKAEPILLNSKNSLNNKTIKTLGTVETINNFFELDKVDGVLNWCSTNNLSLGTNNPEYLVNDEWYQKKTYQEKELYLQKLTIQPQFN
jgi:hypothetical protein